MSTSEVQQQRCQRIGCSALFSPDDNPEGSCHYHPGPPLFHDGGKEWSCCKQRSHDFSLFLEIPGCTIGKHTSEKPQPIFTSSPKKPSVVQIENSSGNESRSACSRCRQGFFCSAHGSQQPGDGTPKLHTKEASRESKGQKLHLLSDTAPNTVLREANIESNAINTDIPKMVDLNSEQLCKNCKVTYTEKDNHDTACKYHPGPPIFHDRSRGWACCDVHVKEFDEFLTIPGCMEGWHKAS